MLCRPVVAVDQCETLHARVPDKREDQNCCRDNRLVGYRWMACRAGPGVSFCTMKAVVTAGMAGMMSERIARAPAHHPGDQGAAGNTPIWKVVGAQT